jgi:hypothetical protein
VTWVALLALTLSCIPYSFDDVSIAGDGTEKPGQPEAVALVWGLYGATENPPIVKWVQGTDLTCLDPNTGLPGLKTPGGCREGVEWIPTFVQVAWREGDNFSDTTLAHEFMHAAQAYRLILDTDHSTQEFKNFDQCKAANRPMPCGIVEYANELLVAEGQ